MTYRRGRDEPRTYNIGLVCTRGHAINSRARTEPNKNSRFCTICGAETIRECPSCKSSIRGKLESSRYIDGSPWNPPGFCHECGNPFPWTKAHATALSELLDELGDQLDDGERAKLKESIPDIIRDTENTPTATERFRRAITKVGGKMIETVLTAVATAYVKQTLDLK